MIKVVFRYDDFGLNPKASTYECKLIDLFIKNNAKLVLGVVPSRIKNTNQSINKLIDVSAKNNFEIAMHGYNHKVKRIFKLIGRKVNGEFRGVPKIFQRYYLIKGKKKMNIAFKQNNLSCFIPPWNQYDHNTIEILSKLNFSCISAGNDKSLPVNLSKLNFIPFTHALEKWEEVLDLKDINVNNLIIVLLFHHYNIKIEEIERCLDYLTANRNFEICTFNDLETLDVENNT